MAWAYKSSAGKRSKKDGKERGNKDKWKQRFVRASNNPEPHVWWFKSDKVGFAHVLLTLDCRLTEARLDVRRVLAGVGRWETPHGRDDAAERAGFVRACAGA